jgi:hypothetical protein
MSRLNLIGAAEASPIIRLLSIFAVGVRLAYIAPARA